MRDKFSQSWDQADIKGVVFDMDGVLVDTSPCHAAAYLQLWQTLGIQGPDYSLIAGRSTKEVIAEYAAKLSSKEQGDAVALKQSAALKILAETDVGFADIHASLECLKAMEMPMAIATSASKASADLALEQLAIRDFFQAIITSEDVAKSKPEPDLFIAAIAAIGVDADKVLILEDSMSGIVAALASGAYAVTVRQAETLTDELRQHAKFLGHFDEVKLVVDKLHEVSTTHTQTAGSI